MSFYTNEELKVIGLGSFGNNVLISRKTSIYNPSKIHIGNNVRIDDFCVLSAGFGGIIIGNYVHIAVYCSLIGAGKITLSDFSGLSSRVSIYSSNADYSGEYLTNPTVPEEYSVVTNADVYLGKHAVIGAGSIVLPGVNVGEGSAVGSMSLVVKNVDDSVIVVGVPAKFIKNRSTKIFELEKELA